MEGVWIFCGICGVYFGATMAISDGVFRGLLQDDQDKQHQGNGTGDLREYVQRQFTDALR